MNLRNCAKFAKRWNLNAVFESLFELNILSNFDEASEIYKIVFEEAKAAERIQIQIEPQPKILVKQIPKISDAALFFILYFSKINGIVKIAMDPANDEYSIYEHVSLEFWPNDHREDATHFISNNVYLACTYGVNGNRIWRRMPNNHWTRWFDGI